MTVLVAIFCLLLIVFLFIVNYLGESSTRDFEMMWAYLCNLFPVSICYTRGGGFRSMEEELAGLLYDQFFMHAYCL
uniref:Histidine triad nucleotide-binding protein 3 n=1 Tax=Rhizophora mucronata TaxID=61149 RepID=A0A2P2KJT2_RHIMU